MSRPDRCNLGCPDCASKRNERGYSLNERILFELLIDAGYKCRNRIHINSFEFDIILDDFNILIEYDGNYWHEFDYKIVRDNYKNKLAYELGYTLVRIRDTNLSPLNSYNCINILLKDFNNIYNVFDYIKQNIGVWRNRQTH